MTNCHTPVCRLARDLTEGMTIFSARTLLGDEKLGEIALEELDLLEMKELMERHPNQAAAIRDAYMEAQ